MAMEIGSARLIKEEKQNMSLKGLSNREISMLFTLVIVAVLALTIYFVLFPMYTNLATLKEKNEALTIQSDELSHQIALTPGFKNQYDEAKSDYYRYIAYFFSPMEPELIDERITSMLIAHGMTPATLTMTTLQVEGIPKYSAQELRANPVPVPLENVNAGGQGTGGGTSLDDAADEAEAAAGAPPEEVYSNYAFVYTIKVSAHGNRNSLFTFLAQVAPMTAMHVTEFSYTDPITVKATNPEEKDTVIPGTINMTIKMYVFVEGVTAGEQKN